MSPQTDSLMPNESLIGYYRRLKHRYAINKHRATTASGKAKNEWLIEECYALIHAEWKKFEGPATALILYKLATKEGTFSQVQVKGGQS